jgi:hypothetical protein
MGTGRDNSEKARLRKCTISGGIADQQDCWREHDERDHDPAYQQSIELPAFSAFLSNQRARPGNLRVMRLPSLLDGAYNSRRRMFFF